MMSSNFKKVSLSLKNIIHNFHKQIKITGIVNTMYCNLLENRIPNRTCHSTKAYKEIDTCCIKCNNQHDGSLRAGVSRHHYQPPKTSRIALVTAAGIFSFFQTKEDEEESELIMTIKRAVLMIQHDDFKNAEQMLHVALRLAQQTQNSDGITYVHDLLANVAFALGELDKDESTKGEFSQAEYFNLVPCDAGTTSKRLNVQDDPEGLPPTFEAEVLFKDVMKRELAKGTVQDDLKIIHMSLKLAKIYEQKHDWMKAEEGYKFCMKHLEKHAKGSEDEDVLMLWGMTLDWYARFLHEQNRLEEAFSNYKKAYEMCVRLNGEVHEQTVILLNDLGTISFLRGDNDSAIFYMTKAVDTGRHLPNMEDFSSVFVNLGNIYIQKEMYKEAEKSCVEGMKNAKRHKNEEGMKEAVICLEELKKHRWK